MIRTEEITIVITETHPRVSTLEVAVKAGRKVGNTTRQINFAIDRLFEGYVIEVKDHYKNGEYRPANELLFKKILERLEEEHNVVSLITSGRLILNFNKLELEII